MCRLTPDAPRTEQVAATLNGRLLLDYLHDEVGLIEEFGWLVAQVRRIEAEAATPADSLDAPTLAAAIFGRWTDRGPRVEWAAGRGSSRPPDACTACGNPPDALEHVHPRYGHTFRGSSKSGAEKP